MPWIRKAPIITAVAALPGMPRVSRWIMAPPVEPLTELSEATTALGVGANVLVRGSLLDYMLQPLSVQGQTGLNVALGVAGLTLAAR